MLACARVQRDAMRTRLHYRLRYRGLQPLLQRQLFGVLRGVRVCHLPVVHDALAVHCFSLCGALQLSGGVRLQVHASAPYFGPYYGPQHFGLSAGVCCGGADGGDRREIMKMPPASLYPPLQLAASATAAPASLSLLLPLSLSLIIIIFLMKKYRERGRGSKLQRSE